MSMKSSNPMVQDGAMNLQLSCGMDLPCPTLERCPKWISEEGSGLRPWATTEERELQRRTTTACISMNAHDEIEEHLHL